MEKGLFCTMSGECYIMGKLISLVQQPVLGTQPCTCTVSAGGRCAPWAASTVLTPTVGSIWEGSVSHVAGLHLYSKVWKLIKLFKQRFW